MKRLALSVCVCVAVCASVRAEGESPLDRERLEKQFSDLLTGAELVGSFTTVGKEDGKAPKEEKYEIVKATKLDEEHWLIVAKWGKADVAIPLRLKVKWAGDTPMISLTDFTIPGMGTFTSRVMFYGDRYAGTWQHDDVGGHLWGTIRKKDGD